MKFLAFLAALLFAGAAYADNPVTFRPTAATNITTNITTAVTATIDTASIKTARLVVSQDTWVVFTTENASSITQQATNTSTQAVFLPADVPEYFRVDSSVVLSVIADSVAGTIYISEMSQ